ncbi:MAG: TetR/AcrR family transcriptional regulator [Lachnospiraceae bacterium]|nr:TetR/AcrR family transcriptional regulator [Lachnospiraceae bacterium]
MPRKQSVTKETLVDAAFELVREKGKEELSARHLALKAGCSTQPIFRIYKSMTELDQDLFLKCADYFSGYFELESSFSVVPFVNFGMTYISFAKNEPNIFRILFLNDNDAGKSTYDLVNGGQKNYVIKELKRIEGLSPNEYESVFMKVWLVIHGTACMMIRNEFDISEKDTVKLLEEMFAKIYE